MPADLPAGALQPLLAGSLVRLRPMRADDWDAFYAVVRDPLIWAQHPFHTRWQEPVARAFFADGLASGGGLMIEDVADGAVIGGSRYKCADDAASVEIGWTFLARSHWGGTYNREVKRLMLAHAFGFFDTVTFRIDATNRRSRTAIGRIGAVLTPRVELTEVEGVPVEHVIYTIDRAGFATGPLAPTEATGPA